MDNSDNKSQFDDMSFDYGSGHYIKTAPPDPNPTPSNCVNMMEEDDEDDDDYGVG